MKNASINQWWQWYINLGVTSALEEEEILKIRMMNQMYIFCTLVFAINGIVNYFGDFFPYQTDIGCIVIFFLCSLFSYTKRYRIGWYIAGHTIIVFLTLNSYFKPGYYSLLCAYGTIYFVVYLMNDEKKNMTYSISFIIINILLFFYFCHSYPNDDVSLVYSLVIIILCIVADYFFILVFLEERQKREMELKSVISLKEAAFNANKDATLVIDRKRKVVDYNDKYKTLWDLDSDVIGELSTQILWNNNKSLIKNKKEVKHTLKATNISSNINTSDIIYLNDGRVIECYTQPQILEDEIIGRIYNYRDVTDYWIAKSKLKKQEEELTLLNQELEDKVAQRTSSMASKNQQLKRSNAELEQFAYIASHDLQEPLRMISNFVKLLEKQYVDKIDAEGKEYIKFIVGGVDRMSALIQSLLRYSRVGRREGNMQFTDLNKIIEAKLFGLSVRIKELKAEIEIEQIKEEIYCEADQIGLVFYNLLTNALKFNQKSPKIQIGFEEQDSSYLFFVKDNGIGIDHKYQKRIFEIFKRLHRKEDYEGTGIGLALCKKIISRHGGEIWFESQINEGTVFYFTINKGLHLNKAIQRAADN